MLVYCYLFRVFNTHILIFVENGRKVDLSTSFSKSKVDPIYPHPFQNLSSNHVQRFAPSLMSTKSLMDLRKKPRLINPYTDVFGLNKIVSIWLCKVAICHKDQILVKHQQFLLKTQEYWNHTPPSHKDNAFPACLGEMELLLKPLIKNLAWFI